MNIVIFGPPGAGKGTQSKFIVKKFNMYQLSTGEFLRREMLKISPGNRKKGETVFKNLDSQGVRSTETFVLDLGALIET